MYFYVFGNGELGHFSTLLLAHEEKLGEEELIENILSKWEEAKIERERLEIQKWDECEQLFGVRNVRSALLAVSKRKRGTPRELLDWTKKWDDLLPVVKARFVIAARSAGFKVLFPEVSIHFGWGIEDFFERGGKEFKVEDYL